MPDQMKDQFEIHQRVVAQATKQVDVLVCMSDRLIECIDRGGKIYIMGNGGSAADAQHIAAEMVGRFKHDRRALPAIALTTDSSILTAVTNDVGGNYMFLRQVEALVTDRDIVWALSVSGTSTNVIQAMQAAKKTGAYTIGFSGKSGGHLKELCDSYFLVDHEDSDRVQEVHQLAYHLICDRIERNYLS